MTSYPPVSTSRLTRPLLTALLLATLPACPAAAQTERWIVDSTKSRVGFDAFHPFGNFSGASEGPTGEIELDIQDLKKPVQGTVVAPVATLRTGKAGRDRDLRQALDGEHNPSIRYRIDKMESAFVSLAENTDMLLTIHGVLTMRGMDGPVTFLGRLRLRGTTLWARGESRIRPGDFGVPPLRSWLVPTREYVLATFDLILTKAQAK